MTEKKQKKWQFYPENPTRLNQLARELKVSNILARCLLNRSIEDVQQAKEYLQPELGQLVDPFSFVQMEKAVRRIEKAIENEETILIHGDYDVDGVTGTVLLLQLFKVLKARATYHIPNRLEDGFSFSPASLDKIEKEKASLVITIDNGITAVEAITELKNRGVDVIITDHHQPENMDNLPPAVATINPNLPGSGYPHGDLCGVAVAFKLAWAVAQSMSPDKKASPSLKQFLVDAMSWVAVGTVTDIVPLKGENRVFAKFGLAALAQSQNPGLKALIESAGLKDRSINAEDVAFRLGPRINAAGRLGEADKAIELFSTNDPDKAHELAQKLQSNNETRKNIENRIHQDARQIVADTWDFQTHPVIVLASEQWHAGVIGIVCSRLVEEFHAPTILIALEGEEGRGSARSLGGFSIYQAMAAGQQHVLKFGGHAFAAGLEIKKENVKSYCEAVNEEARRMLQADPIATTLPIDAEVLLPTITKPFMKEVLKLGPFGAGNSVPVFASHEVKVSGMPRRVGKNGEHVQFHLQQGNKIVKAIGFRMGDRFEEIVEAKSLSVAFTPKINFWAGRQDINLEILDFVSE